MLIIMGWADTVLGITLVTFSWRLAYKMSFISDEHTKKKLMPLADAKCIRTQNWCHLLLHMKDMLGSEELSFYQECER